jgi:hypothetical protein
MEQLEPPNKQATLPTDTNFTGATLTLTDEQRAELDNQLKQLHRSLASASSKLDELREPYIEISNSDLYKHLLRSIRAIYASATSTVLGVLELLQLVLNKAKSENAKLLIPISINSNLASTDGG